MSLKDMYRTRKEWGSPESVKVALEFASGKTVYEYRKAIPLRYGTNPHQASADYELIGSILTLEEIKTGKSGMSQTNMEDLLHACCILKYFNEPTCAVMKHLNPCGVAVKETTKDAFDFAWDCDYQAAYGSVVVFNKPIDRVTAHSIQGYFIEVVGAPDFDDDALDILEKKKDLRVIKISGIEKLPKFIDDETVPNIKSLEGTLFLETPYLTKIRSTDDLRNRDLGKTPVIVSKREPTERELKDLLSAWYVCSGVRSNGIVLWKNGYSVGIGTGQHDRVTAVRQAIAKSKYLHGYGWHQVFKKLFDRLSNNQKYEDNLTYSLKDAVIASDAFFPFHDSIEACGEVGITAVIQPGDSINDGKVIDAANKYDIAMVFTGERCFAHH